jgi:thiol-disulfide isomerase/thioredoxin
VGALVLLASSCSALGDAGGDRSTDAGEARSSVLRSDVDVDTPALREARRRAGVDPCPRTAATAGASDDAQQPAGLPDLSLPCLGGGRETALAGLRGPAVVNLWAQWCGPCREELPHYQRLHEEAAGRVQVLGIDYLDPRPEAALDLVREAGVTYPSLADVDGELRAPLRVRGLPVVLLVDERGAVVHTAFVVIESYDQLRKLVREHLDVAV